jgi:N-acetylmuramoyl-L-alanine amidase
MPKEYTVQAGDSVESIAYDSGFFWETVWDYPANSQLRKIRDDPNILEENDVVVVPDKRQKQDPGATNNRHRFKRKGIPSILRVQLLDQDKPRAGVKYTVSFGEKKVSGSTDGDGWIKQFLMPDVTEGKLELETGEVYNFTIGTVRPAKSLRGVQNRLRNLGFYGGPIDGQKSYELTAAIEKFQSRKGLPVTGEVNAATQAALVSAHQS